jgi:hypothetical protein
VGDALAGGVAVTGEARWGYGVIAPEDSREALKLTLIAVPAGLLAGMLAGWMLSARKARR